MGRLLSPRGVAGWIKVKTFTGTADALAGFRHWWLRDGASWRQVEVEASEVLLAGLSVKLAGVDDRTMAEKLRGADVALSRSDLPRLDDEIYWVDLIGLEVRNTEGEVLGRVDHLLETGANDVLAVRRDEGGELLIPYTGRVVLEVDRAGGHMVVDWGSDWT